MIGVIKAYTTRVGSGPFPTELFDEDGEKLWKVGGEVGVSTGRDPPLRLVRRGRSPATPRRVNGLTELFLTKLDVLVELGAGPGVRGLRRSTACGTTRCR